MRKTAGKGETATGSHRGSEGSAPPTAPAPAPVSGSERKNKEFAAARRKTEVSIAARGAMSADQHASFIKAADALLADLVRLLDRRDAP